MTSSHHLQLLVFFVIIIIASCEDEKLLLSSEISYSRPTNFERNLDPIFKQSSSTVDPQKIKYKPKSNGNIDKSFRLDKIYRDNDVIPTTKPTTGPTTSPTISPSMHPSTTPSSVPTPTPSAAPSVTPSFQPSSHPSRPTPSPSNVPSSVPSSLLETLDINNDVKDCFNSSVASSCFGSTTTPSMSPSWTSQSLCAYYSGSDACPASAVMQYSTPNYPSCPPKCIRDSLNVGVCLPLVYCEVYATLSLGCGVGSRNRSTDIATVRDRCLSSYSRQVCTNTTVVFSAVLVVHGMSARALSNHTAGQEALLLTLQATLGKSAAVSVSSVANLDLHSQSFFSRNEKELESFKLFRGNALSSSSTGFSYGALVGVLVTQRTEMLGIPSSRAMRAVSVLQRALDASVGGNAFITALQTTSQSMGLSLFRNASIGTTVLYLPYQISYSVSQRPSCTPTTVPTIAPSKAPRKSNSTVNSISSSSSSSSDGALTIGFIFLIVGVLVI
eukprot:gene11814-24752_t